MLYVQGQMVCKELLPAMPKIVLLLYPVYLVMDSQLQSVFPKFNRVNKYNLLTWLEQTTVDMVGYTPKLRHFNRWPLCSKDHLLQFLLDLASHIQQVLHQPRLSPVTTLEKVRSSLHSAANFKSYRLWQGNDQETIRTHYREQEFLNLVNYQNRVQRNFFPCHLQRMC